MENATEVKTPEKTGDFVMTTNSGLIDKAEVDKKRPTVDGEQTTINTINFNQSQDYVAVATDKGFELLVNNAEQGRPKRAEDLGESVSLIEMHYASNIVVLVFAEKRNKLVIWDCHERKSRTEITFNHNQLINGIKLRKEIVICCLQERAFIFNFVTLKLIQQLETFNNPMGLAAVATAEQPTSKIVCLPGQAVGSLQLLNFVADKSITLGIQAHNVDLAAITCNSMGTLVATASQRGHIIKIFSTDSGECVQELKRGNNAATISQLVFHPKEHILAVASSTNQSVHLFELSGAIAKCLETASYGFTKDDKAADDEDKKNSKQSFSWMGLINKYYEADACLSKIKLTEGAKSVGFDTKNDKLCIVTHERTMYFADIPKKQQRYIESANLRFF